MPEGTGRERTRLRPFWSGTIAFGLVSLPVSLYVANRGKRVSMKLLGEDGTPLKRQYFCPAEAKPLTGDEIVRGYEVSRGEFVVVSDEELDAVAPEKSQEIDLRRFVALDEIDPIYFERAYFLAPDKGASKAYRLLARAMEEAGRAGIATFVMRGKEYLVAIIAERGVLRAETLRFGDELRTPEDVGLPELASVSVEKLEELGAQIEGLTGESLDRSWLEDRQAQRVLALVERKLEEGDDIVEAAESEAQEEDEGDEVVDLMQLLKESLEEVDETDEGERRRPAHRDRRGSARGGSAGAASPGRMGKRGGQEELAQSSKAELYERAKQLEIPGRSNMSKNELIDAIRQPR